MKWSDREIGRRTGTDHKYVAKVRSSLTGDIPSERTFTTKHGTVSVMNTAAIGADREEVERLAREAAEAKKQADAARAEAARLPHGQFLPWIEAEFGMSDDTARNFINVAKKFGDQIPNYSGFAPTVLIAMASAPPEAVAAIEAKAEAGDKVTVADVKAEMRAKAVDLSQLSTSQTAGTDARSPHSPRAVMMHPARATWPRQYRPYKSAGIPANLGQKRHSVPFWNLSKPTAACGRSPRTCIAPN